MAINFLSDLSGIILAKYSIVYVHSWEENRVLRMLATIAEKQFSKPMKLFVWSQSEGATYKGKEIVLKSGSLKDIIHFLEYAIRFEGNAIFIVKDLPLIWESNPLIVRKIRDLYESFKQNHKTLFIVSNQLKIPPELSKEISIYQFPLPDFIELKQVFDSVVNDFRERRKVEVSLSPEDVNSFVRGVMGLTLDEARRAYNKAFLEVTRIDRKLIPNVLLEKKFLVDKTIGLNYIQDSYSLGDLGGLENMKKWLDERLKCFNPEAKEYKIVPPKGLLISGISGCGKSFAVKGIAGLWDMPLVRLDMNQIYSAGAAGLNFENALKTLEAIAPVLLWIDEIEKTIGGTDQSGEAARIFATFLTWLQEKTSPVFVVATANKINMLPAEMLRKGRFDEIFFIDLPSQEERDSIFRLHISKRNLNVGDFDLQSLTASTEGFSGSEIEQIVVSAVFKGFVQGRKAVQEDFYDVISSSIPMSVMMSEEVKSMKRWASQRAVYAGINREQKREADEV